MQSRILTVIDKGTGIAPERMRHTILSLNESNKVQKQYLAGTYGQGGSSTLYFSKYVFIASFAWGSDLIGFTVAWYAEPQDDEKTGRYVYLVDGDDVITVTAKAADMPYGTMIRHFGYDFSNYTASIGPKSLYGALQRMMFDPIASIRLENKVAGWNRTIKGSRNALNGAVDQGDENGKGPELDYNMPMFNVSLGDFGEIGVEYWLLSRPEKSKNKPSKAFVDDSKPIVLTMGITRNGVVGGGIYFALSTFAGRVFGKVAHSQPTPNRDHLVIVLGPNVVRDTVIAAVLVNQRLQVGWRRHDNGWQLLSTRFTRHVFFLCARVFEPYPLRGYGFERTHRVRC